MLQKVENYRHALDQLEKSIISYSFIEFLSQTQKAAKPFCNDLAAFIWSYWPDLNRRPADYESAALPTEPHQQRDNTIIILIFKAKSSPLRQKSRRELDNRRICVV